MIEEIKEEKEIVLEDSERQKCEIWCRVMGYLRPTSEYNKGKKSEFADRVPFVESKCRVSNNEQ